MIKNDRQYRITRAAAEKFEDALRRLESGEDRIADVDPAIGQAERDAVRSQLDELNAQLREYDELASGKAAAEAVRMKAKSLGDGTAREIRGE